MATSNQRAAAPSAPTATPAKLRVLFVCLGNCCRSPMAEAIARSSAGDVLIPASAGVMALGSVAEFTVQVLSERGIHAGGLRSKQLTAAMSQAADLIVNMAGAPAERWLGEARRTEDWSVADPYGGPLAGYRESCDEIELRVGELAARLRAAPSRRRRSRSAGADVHC